MAAEESCNQLINSNYADSDKNLSLELGHGKYFYPLPSIQEYHEDKQKISEIEVKETISRHKAGEHLDICSVRPARLPVIGSALRLDLNTDTEVPIETISNQASQFSGYTRTEPADFRDSVYNVAQAVGFPYEGLILGGDHLGPNYQQNEPAAGAIERSVAPIKAYATTGSSRVHLDASMSCTDDLTSLGPVVVTQQATVLCQTAETTATEEQKHHLIYVVEAEVPVPGGGVSTVDTIRITREEDAARMLEAYQVTLHTLGLRKVLARVIVIVVQPSVRSDHAQIIHYQPRTARALSAWVKETPVVCEVHSAGYQIRQAYRVLIRNYYVILRVGPTPTSALRETTFALMQIENELVSPEQRNRILEIINEVMSNEPDYWKRYYRSAWSQAMVGIHLSLPDRIRYYRSYPYIRQSTKRLITNLSDIAPSLGLISQFMSAQLERLTGGALTAIPYNLIIDKIQGVLHAYRLDCAPAIA